MACSLKKCGLVKTQIDVPISTDANDPTDPTKRNEPPGYSVTDDSGRTVHYHDVLEAADTALQDAVKPNPQIAPDPEYPSCEESNCMCAGVVWTPRPSDSVPVTAKVTMPSGQTFTARTTATRTISDGVGRCAPKEYTVAFGFGPNTERGLAVALKRDRAITGEELAKIQKILS